MNPGPLLEKALSFFEGKVIRSGHGLRSYWFICALCSVKGLAPTAKSSESVEDEIIGKLIHLYSTFLSLQANGLCPAQHPDSSVEINGNGPNGSGAEYLGQSMPSNTGFDAVRQSSWRTNAALADYMIACVNKQRSILRGI